MSTGTTIDPRRRLRRLLLALAALGALLLTATLITLLVDRIFFHSAGSPAGTGSGVAATETRSLPPFTGVDLAGDNNVTVHVGAKQSVIVHADSNLLERVTTQVRSGKLVIEATPGNLSAKSPMFVSVSLPSLETLRLEGDGNISATGINSHNLAVELPGSGNLHAAGTTTKLRVTISGVGTTLLRQLSARDVSAALSGNGTIMLTATHRLTARISGSGTILYGGNPPHVTRTVTGSGTISPG